MSFGYGSDAICESCGALNGYGVITVSLPLPAEEHHRYFCPKCSLIVAIPKATENRFILQLRSEQTDGFGNASWFRSRLAAAVKVFASSERIYAPIKISQMPIDCPEDRIPMEPWLDYPTPARLFCRECGKRAVTMADTASSFSGSILTPW